VTTPDEVVAALSAAMPAVLVALDFDGTLAPLQPDPDASRPVEATIDVLTDLAGRGAQVAVVTGRDAATALRLGGFDAVPRIVVAGLYGLEHWTDGALSTPETPDAMTRLAERLPEVLRRHGADPAVWIEDKRLSLVVHGRKAADPEGVLDPLRDPVAELAGDLGLDVHPGNGVIEIRLRGFDKAGVLRRLVDERDYRGMVFGGDDVGDVPAFEEIRRLRTGDRAAFGVAVEASGVAAAVDAADLSVPTAADLVALLRRI
jgi:trehalose 6-phosphate phosphatase